MISGLGRSRREAEDDQRSRASGAREVAVPRPVGRQVNCPHCDTDFEVSIRAFNARCPKCTKPMRFEDAELNGFCTQNVTTMGTVRVGRKGVVRGKIECGQLVVIGQLDGHIRTNGRCVVQANGSLRGDVTARSMVVERGGSFEGTLELGSGARAASSAA